MYIKKNNSSKWFNKQNRYRKISTERTHPVGQKSSNNIGLSDMSGNVWEICADEYGKDYYKNSPIENPTGNKFI